MNCYRVPIRDSSISLAPVIAARSIEEAHDKAVALFADFDVAIPVFLHPSAMHERWTTARLHRDMTLAYKRGRH